jgi:hypothetical protein
MVRTPAREGHFLKHWTSQKIDYHLAPVQLTGKQQLLLCCGARAIHWGESWQLDDRQLSRDRCKVMIRVTGISD